MYYYNIMDQVFKTLNEIKEKFKDLPREKKMEILKYSQSELNKDIKDLNVKIGLSRYGGNGLFATRDFEMGEIVTKYQPYLILDKKENSVLVPSFDLFNKLNDDEKKKTIVKFLKEYDDYIINIGDDIHIYGNPHSISNQNYLGHMTNDKGYHPNKIYKKELCNTFYDAVFLIANKPIKKGDELTTAYGKKYWYDNNNDNINGSRHLRIKKALKHKRQKTQLHYTNNMDVVE